MPIDVAAAQTLPPAVWPLARWLAFRPCPPASLPVRWIGGGRILNRFAGPFGSLWTAGTSAPAPPPSFDRSPAIASYPVGVATGALALAR